MDTLTPLIEAAQRGDLDAFGRVVERFQRMAHSVAYAMLGDAQLAEDAAQEAFIEAFVCLPKLREPAAFPGWFRRIVLKRGDRLIRGKHLPMVTLDAAGALPSGAPDLAAIAEAHELRRQVQAAIAELSETDRQLVVLFYLGGYAQQEIAAIVELPVAAVKKRLFHARQRLRRLLDGVVREQLPEPQPADRFTRLVQFFIAVRIGDVSQVQAYLADDAALVNIHERWDEATAQQHGLSLVSHFTALHRAAYNGDARLAELLLRHDADIEARTRHDETPLHVATAVYRPALVEQLLRSGADPNSTAAHGLTALHYAAIRNRGALAQLLLQAGADPSLRDQHGRSPRDWARHKGYAELGKLLDPPRIFPPHVHPRECAGMVICYSPSEKE